MFAQSAPSANSGRSAVYTPAAATAAPGHPLLRPPADAADFLLPYAPYSIQVNFMNNVYDVIEHGRIGIFESPTGTGKSLSLICGSLKWLLDDGRRNELADGVFAERLSDDEPDWILAHESERKRLEEGRAREQKAQQRAERVRRAKENVLKRPLAAKESGRVAKKARTREICSQDRADMEDFIVDDYDPDAMETASSSYISLGNKLAAIFSMGDGEAEPEERKIYFCSRTHSQLSQLVGELRKTPYADISRQDRSVVVLPLGSRKNLCINESVRKLGCLARMNDRCLDMQKKGIAPNKRCPHLPRSEEGSNPFMDFTDAALAEPHDIEELADIGRALGVCPYYGARNSIKQPQIVVLPYNLLLHKKTRESSGIDLKGNVVIIDEAHNLIDAINAANSAMLTVTQVRSCHAQLSAYFNRYHARLKGKNVMYIRQILALLVALRRVLERGNASELYGVRDSECESVTSVQTVNEFIHALKVDTINLFKLEQYMKDSRIVQKLNGFVEALDASANMVSDKEQGWQHVALLVPFHRTLSHLSFLCAFFSKSWLEATESQNILSEQNTSSSLQQVLAFLICLTNNDRDGRIILITPRRNNGPHDEDLQIDRTPRVEYLLLNPAARFKDVVEEARSVVLAGGTMEPVSDIVEQLFPGVPRDRLHYFSCGHIVAADRLLALTVSRGPSGQVLEFTYETRGNDQMQDELGQVLANVCNIIPDGVVCFFVSYKYLGAVVQRWESTGLWQRLQKKKKIFVEPRQANLVEKTLQEYAAAIDAPDDGRNGSLLLSVVGGKMSEGINFADRMGRGVVMVGMPYPNLASVELVERLKHMDRKAHAVASVVDESTGRNPPLGPKAKECYDNLCMRAVNQSIGRAIRHVNDYAVILLVDRRFTSLDVRAKLPRWIAEKVAEPAKFGNAVASIAAFFRKRKLAEHITL